MERITVAELRARIGRRHRLARSCQAADPVAALPVMRHLRAK